MKNPNILIVDDNKNNILVLEGVLEDLSVEFCIANSGQDALGILLEEEIALILLDVQMPEMDGFECASLIKKMKKTRNIPIIFLTALSGDDENLFKGYENGAVDFISKTFNEYVLKSKVNIFIELYNQKKKIEEHNLFLKELSIKDGLTGIYNHRHMQNEINREFALAIRNNTDLSVLMLDIDHFKKLNDNYGHSYGDNVLKKLTKIISKAIRESDIFARYGGEEFLVILPTTDLKGGQNLAESIREEIENGDFSYKKINTKVTISIGVSTLKNFNIKKASELIENADKELYNAKNNGRNRVCSNS